MTKWTITTLDRDTVDGFVTTAHWSAAQTDGVFSALIYNTVSFTKEEGINLIPYEDLTEEIVIGWVKASLGAEGVESVDSTLTANITEQQVPKKATGTPWSN